MPLITSDLDKALIGLKSGNPVAIPTETVYGLAAPIDKDEAIKAVFAMKNRPLNHPLIVHVAKDWNLDDLVAHIPHYAQQLIQHFWPGPLTLVFRGKNPNPLITGGQDTIAIRCPAHELTQQLLQQLEVPVVAPSANPFGKISPTTAQHVADSFPEHNLLILEGGRCEVGIESTIVDATDPACYRILRHGLIDEQAINAVIATHQNDLNADIRVPGRLESHYQPQKTLYYFEDYLALAEFCDEAADSVYVLATQRPDNVQQTHFHHLSQTPEKVAFDLYYQLRAADASNAALIAIELPAASTPWHGIRERILKAGIPYIKC